MQQKHTWILAVVLATVSFGIEDVFGFVPEPPAEAPNSAVLESRDKTSDKKLRPELSDAEVDATLKFAAVHHPELSRLLEHLRKSRPHEFQRATRELNQQIQILHRLQEKNSPRYSQQLELWKTDSQIRVLVAKWSRTKDRDLELEIRELLQQRRDMKLAQLKVEQLRLTGQLQKVEKQIASFEESSDPEIEREWEQLAKKTNSNVRKKE